MFDVKKFLEWANEYKTDTEAELKEYGDDPDLEGNLATINDVIDKVKELMQGV